MVQLPANAVSNKPTANSSQSNKKASITKPIKNNRYNRVCAKCKMVDMIMPIVKSKMPITKKSKADHITSSVTSIAMNGMVNKANNTNGSLKKEYG